MNLDATDETIAATAEAMQLAGLLDDRFGHSDDARVTAWAEQIQRHELERDDLLDAVQAFYDIRQPYSLGIGDLLDAARALRRDRAQRETVDARLEHMDTTAARKAADETRTIAEAFAAAAGSAPRTPRLVEAEHQLQRCQGKRESMAAIREFLAAKAEAREQNTKTRPAARAS